VSVGSGIGISHWSFWTTMNHSCVAQGQCTRMWSVVIPELLGAIFLLQPYKDNWLNLLVSSNRCTRDQLCRSYVLSWYKMIDGINHLPAFVTAVIPQLPTWFGKFQTGRTVEPTMIWVIRNGSK
jgi:hypothetical protein